MRIKPTGQGAKITETHGKGSVSKKGKTPEALVAMSNKVSKAVQGKIPVVKHTAQPYAPTNKTEKKIPKIFARSKGG